MSSEHWADVRSWATGEFDVSFGWPGVFYTVAAALDARRRFFDSVSRLKVIGLGLPRSWLEDFVLEATPSPSPDGFAPVGESGFLRMARRAEPLATGYHPLGFELLNLEMGHLVHSWLCNGLEVHCSEALGIVPGPTGLIDTYEEAERCLSEINKDDVGREPGLWLPWWLVEYPSG
jgi:hypothetical protein